MYSTQPAVAIPIAHPQAVDPWARLVFSFRRPLTVNARDFMPFTASSKYIVAWGTTPPRTPDNPASQFNMHAPTSINYIVSSDFTVQVQAAGNGTTPTTPTVTESGNGGGGGPKSFVSLGSMNYETLVLAHGIFLFIAWAVAPFPGIFIARFLKNKLGVWWYRLHVGLMVGVTGIFSIVGVLLVFLFKPRHFHDPHEIIGAMVIVGMVIQFILGFVANAMFDVDRPRIPWWDKAHWWVGRSMFVLGIVNCYLGIQEYKNFKDFEMLTWTIVFWTWIIVGFLIQLGGQIWFGQIHHMQGKSHHIDNWQNDSIPMNRFSSPTGGNRFSRFGHSSRYSRAY
ncbi:hypothetical protein HK097_005585 [Rhizophlyctis rosea]|uniref:Cytochrome b561 domain-containing protein n=1 Tax=Rhizophlyctis rosea TaxID=64517 RepID=A0AAD5X2F1_9FUNG|nr:hypothetical protein HK097_005585 [Rhizophlyctis rosea]